MKRLAFILLALVVPSVAIAAEGPPVAEERFESLNNELEAARGWRSLAHARRLQQPGKYLDPAVARGRYLETAQRLSEAPTLATNLASALLTYNAARIDLERGEVAAASDLIDGLGFVRNWSIIGPFENGNNVGFDAAYGPESGTVIDDKSEFEGKGRAVRWRDLGFLYGGYAQVSAAVSPARSVVVYTAAVVRSPRRQKVVLRVGAEGAYKLWVGRSEVARVATDYGAALDRDAWGVELQKGDNLVVLKLAGENRGSLGFYLRVTDEQGAPVGLSARAAASGTGVRARPKGRTVTFDTASPSQRAAASAGRDPEALVDAAFLGWALRRLDPETPWRDLADRAVQLAPTDPEILLHAAQVQPEHWRRVELMEAAWENSSDDPWLQVQSAQTFYENMGIGDVPRVLTLLSAVRTSTGPAAVVPALVETRVIADQGRHLRAMERLRPAYEKWPRSAPVLRRALALCERVDDEACRTRFILALAALQPGTSSAVVAAARLESKRGDPQAALSRLDALLAFRPDAFVAHELRARILQQLGRTDEAIAGLDRVLSLSPGLVGVLVERGRLMESLGRDPDAIASYAEALEIAPERRDLGERIQALQPDAAGFEADFRWAADLLAVKDTAARERKGQDYYFIGRQEVVKVAPTGRSTRFSQEIVHVLNDEGARSWSARRFYYSPGFERVEIASVRVRKPDGSVSESYRRSDYDAGTGSGNLYYLRKYAYIEVPPLAPGDVVEYAWFQADVGDDNYREGYFGALWYFDASVDVERTRFAVISDPGMPLYSHLSSPDIRSTDQERQAEDGKPERVRSWEATGLTRVQTDRRMPKRAEVFSHLLVSTYQTWDQVGDWWWNLIKDQLVVDAEIKALVKGLVAGVSDDREKVRIIHQWVVKNTRYVGIEFGVHGWKPYRTTLCFRRRFGDCKDKASLIKVMLEAAGVEANLVLIRTRRLGGITQTPASLTIFNHAIAYVPKFDLYLDGTAEFSGMNELPFSDQGQLSLIVADGGKVQVRVTDIDSSEKNVVKRTLDVDLSGVEPLVTGQIVAKGADAVFYRRKFDAEDKRRESLETVLARGYPGAKLLSAKFESIRDINEEVRVDFSFAGGGFVRQSGTSRFLLPAGRHFRLLDAYAPQGSRDQDLLLGVPFRSTYALTYRLPKGMRPTSLPAEASEKSAFGSYEIVHRLDGNVLEFEVSYSSDIVRVDVEDYGAYREWLTKMDRALSQPIVLEVVSDE